MIIICIRICPISVNLEIEYRGLLIECLEEVLFELLGVLLKDLEQLGLICVSEIRKEVLELFGDMLSDHSLGKLMHHIN